MGIWWRTEPNCSRRVSNWWASCARWWKKSYQLLAPASRPADIAYRSSVEGVEAGLSVEHLADALQAGLVAKRSAEIERGVCLVGPHRDDLELRLGDGPAKGFASHGESWSFALALRLAAFDLLRADGTDPVLMLDDVFAELDGARRRSLATVAADAEQVLVTAAVPDDVPEELSARTVTVEVQEGPADESRWHMSEEEAWPPEHLAGVKGMDLVRRVLEEARGAAKQQGERHRAWWTFAGAAPSGRRWSSHVVGTGPRCPRSTVVGKGRRRFSEAPRVVVARFGGRGVWAVGGRGGRADRRTCDTDRVERGCAYGGRGVYGVGDTAPIGAGTAAGEDRRGRR